MSIKRVFFVVAFLSPLLMENEYFTIFGSRIPTLIYMAIFPFLIFSSGNRGLWRQLKGNKTFVFMIGYLAILVINSVFVLGSLFWRPDEFTNALWLSTLRRVVFVLDIVVLFGSDVEAVKLIRAYGFGLLFSALASYVEMFVFHHNLFDSTRVAGNEGYQRAVGFFDNPNIFGLTVVYLIISILYLYFSKTNKSKLLVIVCLLLVPPLLMSYSRVAWMSLAFGMMLLFAKFLRTKHKAGLIFTVLIIFGSLFYALDSLPQFKNRIAIVGEDGSAFARLASIDIAYENWRGAPWMGIGAYKTETLDETNALSIHSFYLHALFETGIIGFAISMGFLFSVYRGFRLLAKSPYVADSAKVYCSLACIILPVYYVAIALDNNIQDEFFWYFIAAQIAFSVIAAKRKAVEVTSSQSRKYLVSSMDLKPRVA